MPNPDMSMMSCHGIITQDRSSKWSVNIPTGLTQDEATTQARALLQNPSVVQALVTCCMATVTAQSTATVSVSNTTDTGTV